MSEEQKAGQEQEGLYQQEPAATDGTAVAGNEGAAGQVAGDQGQQQPGQEQGQGQGDGSDQGKHPDEEKPWYRKRFDELTRRYYESDARAKAEREARLRLEAELRKLKGLDEPMGGPQAGVGADPAMTAGAKPTLDQFEGDEEKFLEALADWKVQQTLKAREAEEQNRRQMEEQVKTQAALMAHVQTTTAKGREKYRDFDEKVSSLPPDVLNMEVATSLMEVDNAEDVVYHLATNPEKAAEIARMTPLKRGIELGKIEAELKLKRHIKPQVSNAPEPIKPVGGRAPAGVDLERMSPEEYREYRNKQEAARMGYG